MSGRSPSDNALLEVLFGILMEAIEYEGERAREGVHGHSFFADFERESSLTRKLIVLKSQIRDIYPLSTFLFLFSFHFFFFLSFFVQVPTGQSLLNS